MSEEQDPAMLVGLEEANESVAAISDERVRAFVKYGLTTVLIRRGMDPSAAPRADFDLCFFVEALRAMAEDRATVRRIFEGDLSSMEWWPEE